jgi:hypothetical protein
VTPVDNAWPKSGAVALDSAGNVYVPDPDYFVQQINRYSPDGVFIDTVLRDQEAGPGIGFGTNGHLYATCVGAGAVVRFDQDMRYVGSWRSVPATLVNYVYSEPLATSPLGEVLVGQQPAGGGQSHGCVLRFGLDGKRLGEIVPRDGGDWPAISAVAVAPDGTVFVAYPRAAHVEYYSASGVYQGELHGTAERPFAAPNGLAFDRFGRLWVADGGQLRCFTVKGLGRSLVTLPAAVLPVPTTTGALRRGRSFVISGELRPRHATGTQAVTLFFYQYRSHRWVLGKTVKVRVTDYASYSRYSVSTSLPRSGTWRVRASHSDVSHRASYSGYRTLAVK